ncbi:MAG: hypothetical protein WBK55_06770 [Alphaproteobacteria bacterium]
MADVENVQSVQPEERDFPKMLEALAEASKADTKPIVLELGFKVDDTPEKKIQRLKDAPAEYHLLRLRSARECVAAHNYLSQADDKQSGLVKRLKVSYNGKITPYAKFAMNEESPERLYALYNKLSSVEYRHDGTKEDCCVRLIRFKRTDWSAKNPSRNNRSHYVKGFAGVMEGSTDDVKKILLKEARIDKGPAFAHDLKWALMAEEGVDVIVHMYVDIKEAFDVERDFRTAVENNVSRKNENKPTETFKVHAKLRFAVYDARQILGPPKPKDVEEPQKGAPDEDKSEAIAMAIEAVIANAQAPKPNNQMHLAFG